MRYLLGQVSLGELDRDQDLPLISALVIDKDHNMPSHGFWDLCQELNLQVSPTTPLHAQEAFWLQEIQRCFGVYGKRF